ncbi:SDR family oxidoreductase [Pseudomonas aeruginosa]|uniref:SDR family oxidoreductase n=1 Tax=Pseudomonas aeruginosa TaxID=287 RepID=UPI002340D05D|nr:SDR family oxidoreductase [Pseudomonas aeruginosa]MCO3749138.1 SDR family oxidoreductase [Pseudomonas aeruginosa]MDC3837346.1 SDR family oxidoreductase [Pseudomonas aeruginosa]
MVLLTSAWGVGARDLAAVAAASGGVQVLCKSLARELGSHGVTVNAIAHAFTDSDWLALDAHALDIGENVLRTAPQAYVPAAALGQPAQVAHSVLLLCHPVLGAATGQTLQCNGGYFRHRT